MIESLKQLRDQALKDLSAVADLEKLDELVLKYFGRKQGLLNSILRSLKNLDERQRKILGQQANEVKIEIWHLIDQRRQSIKKAGKKDFVDLTIDGKNPRLGHLHPITKIRREIEKIFREMGFAVMLGPEIETDYYNFEALNMPAEHPARDMWDTFYIKSEERRAEDGEKLVLRTHISPMQVRVMEKLTPPFSVISSGRVFRHEATDARHEHTWDYTEGFVVDQHVSLSNLKTTLLDFFKQLFGSKTEIKLRSSYFPFTEPSIEIIMGCIFCQKTGCSICGQTGWLEMGGAGMIHPTVFEHAGYPREKYSGFAFGLGIGRVAMLKYDIPDVRLFYQNDHRFLSQF